MIKKMKKKVETNKTIIKGIDCNFQLKAFSMFSDNEEKKILFSVFRVEGNEKDGERFIPLSHFSCLEDALNFLRNKMVIYKVGDYSQINDVVQAIKQSNDLIIDQIEQLKKQLKKGKFKRLQKTIDHEQLFNRYREEEEKNTSAWSKAGKGG